MKTAVHRGRLRGFPPRPNRRRGFTLLEVFVAMVVLMLIMIILLSLTSGISRLSVATTAKIEQFRGARDAFEAMTRRIGQATLNTYWDYDNPAAPSRYVRQSELRFVCGRTEALAGAPPAPRRWPSFGIFFQAPIGFTESDDARGLENLLNTWGYFVEFGDDAALRPPIIGTDLAPLRHRYRLCEFMQPAESMTLYAHTSGLDSSTGLPKSLSYAGTDWFSDAMRLADRPATPARPVHVIAENVVALVLLPKLSSQADPTGAQLAPSYYYSSAPSDPLEAPLRANPALNPSNQLPPVVQVVMVAIDEVSALHLAQGRGQNMPDLGIDGLFASAANLQSDLDALERILSAKHLNFRVFTTSVAIKGAKWSRDEKN